MGSGHGLHCLDLDIQGSLRRGAAVKGVGERIRERRRVAMLVNLSRLAVSAQSGMLSVRKELSMCLYKREKGLNVSFLAGDG